MYDAVVFAGTTEGRQISVFLAENDYRVLMCVASEYGKTVAGTHENIAVHVGCLCADEMKEIVCDADFVIDATHPYAAEVTKNIQSACSASGTECFRLLRAQAAETACVQQKSAKEAAAFLEHTDGNILLSTGSKDLADYEKIEKSRLFVRVLPTAEALKQCKDANILPKNIICMQGPFSEKMNEATIEMTNAKFLVTKNSGNAGGFFEKARAAEMTGATLVVIGRPTAETGFETEQLKQMILKRKEKQ